ncbi:hypothetical protein MAPG_11189 [Magnaporthiopsis poae ATCC 64411]|uniref:Ent-kaurene oxidase n=1 Tax=Magnaporthiopsis poae (strain ATCC 64411 / 73-15) TaxID=644358 RepID=A0A0C4EEL5_MAGP6|nr:hypothetical protein MAPG_11189 [Magnaporthiopsis poae ATCC 64411]
MATSVSAEATWLPSPVLGGHEFDQTTVVATLIALVILPVVASYVFRKDDGLPLINPPRMFQLEGQMMMECATQCARYLAEARKRFPNRPFKLLGPTGRVTFLPPDMALDIKNTPALNFRKVFTERASPFVPALRTFRTLEHPDEMLQNVVKKHLTKRLNTVTGPLARETTFAVDKTFGNSADWAEVNVNGALVDVVARLSSRVFLGAELCRNERWLDITKTYTANLMRPFIFLGFFPRVLQPLIALFDPNCQALKNQLARAREIVDVEVNRRRKERQECAVKGVTPTIYNDAIDWAEMESTTAPYDPTEFQLTLSFAAIHTTSDLLMSALVTLIANPGSIQLLRQEMLEVLPSGGWNKNSLYHLKLMDSAIKESQRLKPTSIQGLQRRATTDIEMPGGLKIRKGEVVSIDVSRLRSPDYYENPDKFDIHRFVNMRETAGGEHKGQLVSVHPDFINFGLGKYACPGRFFAANEVKIALCHLLLKFDWELVPGTSLEPVHFGTSPRMDPSIRVRYKRRVPEFDIDALEVEEEGA